MLTCYWSVFIICHLNSPLIIVEYFFNRICFLNPINCPVWRTEPFCSSLLDKVSASATASSIDQLVKEIWFHGAISRKESEDLLVNDGDFLVRESLLKSGQYVLTGMQGGVRKHLLLIDPEGIVSINH